MGKTIQIIALILSERSPINMPTLIVCPVGVLRQWDTEIYKFCNRAAQVKTLIYHGQNRVKDPIIIAQNDIVLTSYTLLAKEATGIKSGNKTPSKAKAVRKQSEIKALSQVHWFRIVLDECQSVKNPGSKVSAAVASYKACRRWCLSGTPVQNKVFELHSYYRFLQYVPFLSRRILKDLVSNAERGIRQATKLIGDSFANISLRRTKGKPFSCLLVAFQGRSELDYMLTVPLHCICVQIFSICHPRRYNLLKLNSQTVLQRRRTN